MRIRTLQARAATGAGPIPAMTTRRPEVGWAIGWLDQHPDKGKSYLELFTSYILAHTRIRHAPYEPCDPGSMSGTELPFQAALRPGCELLWWRAPQGVHTPGETSPPPAGQAEPGQVSMPGQNGYYLYASRVPTEVLARYVHHWLRNKWASPTACTAQVVDDDVLVVLFEAWFYGWSTVRRSGTLKGCDGAVFRDMQSGAVEIRTWNPITMACSRESVVPPKPTGPIVPGGV